MADNNDKDKSKEIKDLEEQLFREFNEEVNLSEPSDSRLQENVELNPEIENREKEEKEEDTKEAVESKKEQIKEEDKEEDIEEDLSEVELGQVFKEFVSGDQTKEKPDTEEENEVLEDKQNLKEKALAFLKENLLIVKEKAFQFGSGVYKILYKILSPIRWYWSLKTKDKLGLFAIFGGFLLVAYLAQRFYVKYYLNANKSPYLESFMNVEGKTYEYDTNKDFEVFFSPAYTPDYAYVFKKMVANIQPSRNSGKTPMIFVQVVLKASNQDTAIEFKDREVEMRDQTLRTIETFKFDEVRSLEGKEKLKKHIASNLNKILNNGYVTDVLFKHFIVKP